MSYLRAPVDVNVDTLVDRALDRIREQVPGWVPREGHLEVVVAEELARLVAETAHVAADVPDRIFSAYGEQMQDIAQQNGAPATGTVEITAIDAAGYNVPAGTAVAWALTGDERVFFRLDQTVTIAPGTTSVEAPVTAEDPGAAANGLGPGAAELVDQIAFVDQVAFVDETSGGADAETDATYRDRLSDELRLSAPRPIVPDDFAVFARRTPGVHRALALDGYDPDDASTGNARFVALVPVDTDGQPVAATVADDLIADMEARREVNFVVRTTEPDYTPVDIAFTVRRSDGVTDAEALDRVVAAAEAWISPANWGGGDTSPPEWRTGTDTVRYLELASVLSAVDGVEYVVELTINGTEDDLALDGVAPLPAPLGVEGSTVDGQIVP